MDMCFLEYQRSHSVRRRGIRIALATTAIGALATAVLVYYRMTNDGDQFLRVRAGQRLADQLVHSLRQYQTTNSGSFPPSLEKLDDAASFQNSSITYLGPTAMRYRIVAYIKPAKTNQVVILVSDDLQTQIETDRDFLKEFLPK